MVHPLSLAFLTVHDTHVVDAINIAARTGFGWVSLRLLPAAPHESQYPVFFDDGVFADVLAALKATGVRVSDTEIVRLGETIDWDRLARFCDRSALLGASGVIVAGDDTDQARLTDSFGRFCELAAQSSLTADLEFMPWTAVPDLASSRKIVDATGAQNGGVLIDALHFDRSATTTLNDVEDLPDALIHFAQFCDGPVHFDPTFAGQIAVARGGRLFPGEGGIDLIALCHALPARTPISVEVPNHEYAKTVDPITRAKRARQSMIEILQSAGREWS